MDQSSLVEVGRTILQGLQAENFSIDAALWVRETLDENWLLWIAPRTFKGRHDFFTVMAKVLTKLRAQIGYFDISNLRVIEPNSPIAIDLKRYGPVRPDRPMVLQSENLGGFYIKEGVVLFQEG